MAVLTVMSTVSSYRPLGFVAAITVARVFSLQTNPALATLYVYVYVRMYVCMYVCICVCTYV